VVFVMPYHNPYGVTRTKTKNINLLGTTVSVQLPFLKGGESQEAIIKTLEGYGEKSADAIKAIKDTKYTQNPSMTSLQIKRAMEKVLPNPWRYIDDPDFTEKTYGSRELAGLPVYVQPDNPFGIDVQPGTLYADGTMAKMYTSTALAEKKRQDLQKEADRKKKEDDAKRAAEEEARENDRQAAIRQGKIDALNKRITFEKTNPLVERRKSATGRYFEAISPGQEYIRPEGADILAGEFKRLPFISREQYNIQVGETEERILGRGQVKKTGILGEEEEETLGTKTLLGA